jgi:hypothetical protein
MYGFLILLLSLAALAMPASSWAATSTSSNLAIKVTLGQAITGISLSNNTFTGGASGTVVGAIGVTMSPDSPAFSGSLSLSGTNASQFQISGSNLVTNGTVPAGTYSINIVATEAGVSSSPFTQAESITGTTVTTTEVETPGPSIDLFNNPYYTCVHNFYVATNGSDSNAGTSPSAPWRTIARADTADRTGGDCINVAPGNYSAFNGALKFGGTTASSTGYAAYRCTQPGFTVGNPIGGCVITDGAKSVCAGQGQSCGTSYPNYLIVDGFSFIAPSPNTFASAFGCSTGDVGPSARGCHHWVMVNNVIRGYGQGGVSYNNTEWGFALHNLIYNTASAPNCNSSAQGSGISYAASLPVAGYTQTADDIGPTPKLGIYGSTSPNPFHQFIEWNVVYNNHMTGCSAGNATDGNGIILDSLDDGPTGVNYPYRSLVAFNVVYNNGGSAVIGVASNYYTFANNTVFNSYLDTNINGSARGTIRADNPSVTTPNIVLVNNVSYAIRGAGFLSDNSPILASSGTQGLGIYYNGGTSCGLVVDGVADCGGSNVTFSRGYTGSPGGENRTYYSPPWSCAANNCQTDPKWVNVDSTGGNTGSAGTMSTPPVGTNFALQSGSPAIGYGKTRPYLPAQSVDAGACYRTLTSCP